MKNIYLVAVVLLMAGLGVGFFGGMKYQESKLPQGLRQFNGGQNRVGMMQNFGNRNNFRPISGEIISAETNSITVKLADGSSKIVLLSDKTEINEATKAAQTDLKSGEKVAVFGIENSDGSLTAQSIQLNPISQMRVERPQK